MGKGNLLQSSRGTREARKGTCEWKTKLSECLVRAHRTTPDRTAVAMATWSVVRMYGARVVPSLGHRSLGAMRQRQLVHRHPLRSLPALPAAVHARTVSATVARFDATPTPPQVKPPSDAAKVAPSGVVGTFAKKARELTPGVLAAAAVMQTGFWTADHLGQALLAAQGLTGAASPISGIPVSILLGMLVNNAVTLPQSLRPGLKFCTVSALRAGIVCVGAKLSFVDVARLGAAGIPVVMATIGAGLTVVPMLARRLGLPPKLGLLVAAGTSICGVTAITALAPAIKANEREVGLAVANVVAFGTVAMLTYPYLGNALFAHSEQIGMFLGTAIHDTSQVCGAGVPGRACVTLRATRNIH